MASGWVCWRRHEAQRPDHFAIRGVGHLLQFRDNQEDSDVDASNEKLIVICREVGRDPPY
jgi:hypothetical protein